MCKPQCNAVQQQGNKDVRHELPLIYCRHISISLKEVTLTALGQAAATDISNEVTSKVTERYSRRVLTDVLDYDYGGANARHEPRKKPGNGH
ncbi:hypothetical protein ABZP36_030549 [Zizania latifolia]